MASRIWLGSLKPKQNSMAQPDFWEIYTTELRDGHTGNKAIIAKGNIIEGIKAKE